MGVATWRNLHNTTKPVILTALLFPSSVAFWASWQRYVMHVANSNLELPAIKLSRFAPRSVATLHCVPPRWQNTRYMVYILAMQAQNATELGNLGFCSLKRQLAAAAAAGDLRNTFVLAGAKN
jgi:hypothetical protein